MNKIFQPSSLHQVWSSLDGILLLILSHKVRKGYVAIAIKGDLMVLFRSFFNADLPLFCLNYGTIILLPKKENVVQIQQYRPICLLNVVFKILTKVARTEFRQLRRKLLDHLKRLSCQGDTYLRVW
jgi:hypothetical protein